MKGHIFLVNPSHPLPEGYEPPSLSTALPGSEILLESECASALTALLGRIDAWDKIIPVSGYRPRNEQQALWDETMRDYGEIFTRKYVAVPGCSEHETGLAIDLAFNTGGGIDFIRPYFPYEEYAANSARWRRSSALSSAILPARSISRASLQNRGTSDTSERFTPRTWLRTASRLRSTWKCFVPGMASLLGRRLLFPTMNSFPAVSAPSRTATPAGL